MDGIDMIQPAGKWNLALCISPSVILILFIGCQERGDPWLGQSLRLMALSTYVWRFRDANNGSWPASIDDLIKMRGPEDDLDDFRFKDPVTREKGLWLVFPPRKLLDESLRYAIAAAPRDGGPGAETSKRLVMSDSGQVFWTDGLPPQ